MRLFSRSALTHSVRARLLLAAVLVELVMLSLMVANSIRLLESSLEEQARLHAAQIAPVMNAALVAPMAQYDYATVNAILKESQAVQGISYMVVRDTGGQLVGMSGWPEGRPLPPADTGFSLEELEPRYDVVHPLDLSGQRLGFLQYGLDLTHIIAARKNLFWQSLLIAVGEMLLSALLLTAIGLWLTRHLAELTRASEAVASGDLSPPQVHEGDDDLGRLGRAFNAMSQAIGERIQDLQQARDALAQSEERFDLAMRGANDGIWDWNIQSSTLILSPRWKTMRGYSEYELGNSLQTWEENVHPEDLAQTYAAVNAHLQGHTALYECEYRARHKDGHWLWIRDRGIAVRDANGFPVRMVGTNTDVTEQHESRRQLEQAKAAAEAANHAKAAFLATMSHEIRTPMNGILGMVELALMSELTTEQREQLNLVDASARSLLTILSDILDFSKIEAGRLEVVETPVQIDQVLRQTWDMFVLQLREKGLEGRLDLGAPPPALLADPVRLRQIVTNLLSNAVKFTDKGFVGLRLSWHEAEDRVAVKLVVEDSGVGIPADKQESIFAPFEQADTSPTRRFGGTGLGLSLVRQLLELMGGEVRLQSTVGQGSRFEVSLHLAPAQAAALATALPLPEAVTPPPMEAEVEAAVAMEDTPPCILVAEDTPTNQKLILTTLAQFGMRAVLAADGIEAVAAFAKGGIDLVLMDVKMPGMDGLEATREIRRREAAEGLCHTPIIALTANAMVGDREACAAAGMDDFVSKPFRLYDLQTRMRYWLAKRRTAPKENA